MPFFIDADLKKKLQRIPRPPMPPSPGGFVQRAADFAGDVFGDVGQAALRTLPGAAPIQDAFGMLDTAKTAYTGYQRAQQGSLGFFTGDNPVESVQQGFEGLTGQRTFSPQDTGFARLLPAGSRQREAVGNVNQFLTDPASLASLGGGAVVRGAIGAGAIGSEAAGQAAESFTSDKKISTAARIAGGVAGGIYGARAAAGKRIPVGMSIEDVGPGMSAEERAFVQRAAQAQGGASQPTAQRIVPKANIAPWASGPPELKAAVGEITDALKGQIAARRSGAVEDAKRALRARQTGGIARGLEGARTAGAGFEETLQAARSGATVGRLQPFGQPLELTDATKSMLGNYLTDTIAATPNWPYPEYAQMGGLKALNALYQGEHVQPAQLKVFAQVFGDDFAKIAADAVKGRPSAIAPRTVEMRAAIDAALKGERQITIFEQRAAAQAQHADELMQQFRMNPTDPRIRNVAEQARIKGLEFANKADELTIAQGRAYTEAITAKNVRQAAQEGAQTARAGETAAQTAERLRGAQEIAGVRAGTELTPADLAAVDAAEKQGEAGVRRLELLAANQNKVASDLEALAKTRAGDPRYANRAATARAQADSYANQADELLSRQTATGNEASAASQRAKMLRDQAKAARASEAEGLARARLTSDEQTLIAEAKALLGESPGVSSAMDREALKSVEQWIQHARQYRESIGETAHETMAQISAHLSGNLADSYLNTLYQNRLVATRALELSGTDPAIARKVADLLVESQLRARYPGGVPLALKREMAAVDKMLAERSGGASPEVLANVERAKAAIEAQYPGGVPARLQAEIAKTAAPYGGALDTALRGMAAGSQEWKNLAFGPLDFGILGQQGLKATTEMGPINIITGAANRLLNRLGTGFHDPLTQGADEVARLLQYARDGLGVNVSTGAVQPGKGLGVLNNFGPVGRGLNRWIAYNTHLQFTRLLGGLRNLDHEGNLAILDFNHKVFGLGKGIADPTARATSASFANVATSFAPGALNARRALGETAVMLTPSMRRAQVQGIGQVAKVFLPGSTAEERILGSVLILNKYAVRTAIGLAINHYFGVGDYVWDQSKKGAGTVVTRLKGRGGANTVVGLNPQDQVENAVLQSIRALAEADPAEVARVYAKLGIGASGPVPQIGEKAAGFGYQPGKGYALGGLGGTPSFGEGMTPAQRALSSGLIPVPPVAQSVAQGVSPQTVPLDIGGVQNFPESGSQALKRADYSTLTPDQQLSVIQAQAWQKLSTNKAAPPEVKQYESYYDWADAQRALIAPRMAKANEALPPDKRKSPGELDQLTEKVLNTLPVAKAHDAVRNVLKTQWVAANPQLALDNYDRNQALVRAGKWKEQKPEWSLTQVQLDLAHKVLGLKAKGLR